MIFLKVKKYYLKIVVQCNPRMNKFVMLRLILMNNSPRNMKNKHNKLR